MTEPDVVITDYLLAVESVLFAVFLWRQSTDRRRLRHPFVAFFAVTGAASLAGGTVHGFFLSGDSPLETILWRAALLCVGLAALCGWAIGARMLLAGRTARRIQVAAAIEYLAYAVVIVAVDDSFRVAVANYLPATAFLMVAFLHTYRTDRQAGMAGIVGIAATVVAAAVQQLRVAVHPRYFNHNALYHVTQAIALFLILRAAQLLIRQPAEGSI